MYFDLDKIKEQVEQVYEEVLAFRRDLHMHPELSEQEIRTEEKICSRLDALQIPYQRGVAGMESARSSAGPRPIARSASGQISTPCRSRNRLSLPMRP